MPPTSPQACGSNLLCNPATGFCFTSCSKTADCLGTYYCDTGRGQCIAQSADGQPCDSASQCPHGNCVDEGGGVKLCCNQACTSDCMSCQGSLTGQSNGACTNIKVGFAKMNSSCKPSGHSICGVDGKCDGNGSCGHYGSRGTSCGGAVCSGDSVAGQICDGAGLCQASGSASCSPFGCANGTCRTTCSVSTECASGYVCTGGTCTGKRANGEACSGTDQCTSGNCVEGFCCDGPCTSKCQSCMGANTVSGQNGKCDAVSKGRIDPKGQCASSPPCGADETCDGAGRCTAYAASGTQCGGDTCDQNSAIKKACDGFGLCKSDARSCGAYACSSAMGTCATRCTASGDCAAGATCDTGKGECAFQDMTCSTAFSVRNPDGTEESCNGYRCVGGACQQQCAYVGDCADAYGCQGGRCVRVYDAAAGDGSSGGTEVDASGGGSLDPGGNGTVSSKSGCSVSSGPGNLGGELGWIALGLASACAGLRRRPALSQRRGKKRKL